MPGPWDHPAVPALCLEQRGCGCCGHSVGMAVCVLRLQPTEVSLQIAAHATGRFCKVLGSALSSGHGWLPAFFLPFWAIQRILLFLAPSQPFAGIEAATSSGDSASHSEHRDRGGSWAWNFLVKSC